MKSTISVIIPTFNGKGLLETYLQKTITILEQSESIDDFEVIIVDDASSARPDGSMAVDKIYWFKHNSALGQYSAAKVHNSVTASVKDGVTSPKSIDDYNFDVKPLEGLQCDVIEGF